MARYIDADKIPYYLDTSYEAPMEGRKITFKSDIDKIPTADVAPKSEVAMKIFAEIESTTKAVINFIEADSFPTEELRQAKLECYKDTLNHLAKVKKKYE